MNRSMNRGCDALGRDVGLLRQQKKIKEVMDKYIAIDLGDRLGKLRGSDAKFKKTRFLILNMHFWSSDMDYPAPAEISLVQFTAKEGVQMVYNEKIMPKAIPLGLKGDMKELSAKSHEIWMDTSDICEDYKTVLQYIIKVASLQKGDMESLQALNTTVIGGLSSEEIMIIKTEIQGRYKEAAKRFVPIYVMPEHKERIQWALFWLMKQADFEADLILLDLPILFNKLIVSSTAEPEPELPKSVLMAEALLKNEIHMFSRGISCSYHEKLQTSMCASAIALRYVFIILDFLCTDLNIGKESGKHIPYTKKKYDQDEEKKVDKTLPRVEKVDTRAKLEKVEKIIAKAEKVEKILAKAEKVEIVTKVENVKAKTLADALPKQGSLAALKRKVAKERDDASSVCSCRSSLSFMTAISNVKKK